MPDELLFAAVKAGALSYLLKDADAETVLATIHAANRGEAVLHPRVARRLMAEIGGSAQASASPARVTETITERTVKAHVSNLLSKLQLNDRTQAAIYAWREGIVNGGITNKAGTCNWLLATFIFLLA